jgi:amidase
MDHATATTGAGAPRSGDGLTDVPATTLARWLRERRCSAVELLDAHLARIDAHGSALNAVVSVDAEGARRRAADADRALQRGDRVGPLHGIPMTLKDGHDVAGLRTTLGTHELDRVAGEDGTVAARLRAAGANIFGHSNVAAWLADHSQSANPVFGRTANPWDPGRVPGGSSGGAAAALAAGMTPLEVGSDMVGSIRLPAHFCGVYGLKPTEHRVPLTGFFRTPGGGPRSARVMVCLGPMARDIDDLELALRVIAGPDGHDSDVAPVPLEPAAVGRLGDLRLAVAPQPPGVRVSTAVRAQVERVASAASDAGARVDARLPAIDWDELHELFGDLLMTVTGIFAPGAPLREEQRTLAWYLGALARRERFVAAWDAFFADVDALLCPTAMTSAFAHDDARGPIDVDGTPVDYNDQGRLHAFTNLTGMPALAVPAGLDHDGLPVGIQLVGPRWSEMRLLAIARELEAAGIIPGFRRPPGS